MKLFLSALLLISALSAVLADSVNWDAKAPVMDPVAFVRSIKLAEPRYQVPDGLRNRKLGTPLDNKKEGYVVGGAVTAFTANVKGSVKQDILDATLFAQQAASYHYEMDDVINWYLYFTHVLGNIGFSIKNLTFQEYVVSGDTLYMDKAVRKILATIATEEQQALVNATLDALKEMPASDNRVKILNQKCSSSNISKGSFQIYPCEQSPEGVVTMAMGAFYFTVNHHEVRFLFFDWDINDARIYKAAEKVVFMQDEYAKVRDEIRAKMVENAAKLIDSIDLK